jgi:tRNA A-37 threonylcarbamoyl transferase component Bud32
LSSPRLQFPFVFANIPILTTRQRRLLEAWLPAATLVQDHGWGLVQTTVLHVACAAEHYIVKAGGPDDRHIVREIRAHQQWLTPWTSIRRAPGLVRCDEEAKLVVTRYLPGELVLGHPSAEEPDTFRQAGALLAALHAQESVVDNDHERRENARALAWLASPHRIAPAVVAEARARIEQWPHVASVLVPTHGDWQPRNWLVHDGIVSVIDFGRAAMRPAATDLARLAVRDFAREPALEGAFLEGYGADPREPEAWQRIRIREAIATAAWAHQVGDQSFEQEGLRALEKALKSRSS